jgi:hypothetical protein
MKNYRLKETVVNYRDGSKKSFYSIQKRHRLIFWKNLKIQRKMILYDEWTPGTDFITENKEEAYYLYNRIIEGDKKIYGIRVIPVIVEFSRVIVDKYDSNGQLVGGELGYEGGKQFDVNYTCQELLDEGEFYFQKNTQKKLKEDIKELEEYIGKLPRY